VATLLAVAAARLTGQLPTGDVAGVSSRAPTLSRVGERREEMLAAQYFTAVAGMAAMRHCLTEPSAARDRLDDVRAVVEGLDEFPNNLVVQLREYDVSRGYDAWASRYDGPNPAVETDEIEVHRLLADLDGDVALDAACGTGRHSAYLRGRGFEVIGVDSNPTMLGLAESKVPGGDIRLGDLAALPVDDGVVDVVVCSLALTHVQPLEPVIAEFARVTRPGGVVVLSDMHPITVTFGGAAVFPAESRQFELHFVRNLVHPVGEYVRAAAAAGLVVRDCREPAVPESAITTNPAYSVVPDAVRQAFEDLPFLLIWSLEKPRE
jgi:ubiquinone/menaquinone biosynthesis C-methylase UbiE